MARADRTSDALVRSVVGDVEVLEGTLSMTAEAHHAGDVLAATQIISGIVEENGEACLVQSITLTDKDDQKASFTLYFLATDVAMGTEGAAASISDANADEVLGYVDVSAGDWKDLGGVSVVCYKNVGLILKAADDAKNVYLAAVTSGTPTPTASGITYRLGIMRQ